MHSNMIMNTIRFATLSRCARVIAGLTGFALVAAASPLWGAVSSRVEVRGAQFIPEADIQRTCGVEAGVPYSDAELRDIEACLMSTAVFERVSLYRESDVLIIDVVELDTRPGRLSGALFYDSQDDVTARLSYERENLFPGVYGALEVSFNPEIKRLDGRLIWDDALGEGLDFGLSVYGEHLEYDDRSYAQKSIQIEPQLAWRPDDGIRIEVGMGVRQYRMEGVEPGASPLLIDEAISLGEVTAPYLRFGLQLNNLDGDEAVRMGYEASLQQFFWNLGTDDVLSETRVSGRIYVPLQPRTRLVLGLRGGAVLGMDGNSPRAVDRFFPGGEAFRGFAPRGLGPQDGDDVLGGDYYLVGSVELQRQFELEHGPNFLAGIFADVGTSWGLDDDRDGLIDDGWHRRSSLGVSLTFDVADIPVSLYVAHPIEREAGDESQTFGLSVSARF